MKKKKLNKNEEVDMQNMDCESNEIELDGVSNEEPKETIEVDELQQMKEECDKLNDKYLRLHAEYQNYRKRVEKEKSELLKYGSEKLFVELLPVVDNFNRAMSAADLDSTDPKFLEGLGMIRKSLEEFFDKNGVKKIEALQSAFDPTLHHAVMTEDAEGVDSETVTEVFQEGYTLNDKVIRPSMVKVSN